MKPEKLDYINGLKGIGAGIVYLCHFVFTFYYAAYNLKAGSAHLPGDLELVVGKSPLNLLFNGNFAVRLFLVMSGYVLALSFFRTGDEKRLVSGAARRYFRLMPAILVTNVLVVLCMYLGLVKNQEAAVLLGSNQWLSGFYSFSPEFLPAVLEGIFGCFFLGTNQYNGVLWTIPYLFLGAFLVYACAYCLTGKKWRYAVYAALGAGLLLTDYAGVFLGFVLCDLMNTQPALVTWVKKQKILLWIAFALGLYLGSYPSGGCELSGTIYGILGVPRVVLYHLAGALLLVGSVVNLVPLQKFFSHPVFAGLGRISYSLYLVHFPVIVTVGCGLFTALYGKLSYGLLTLIIFIVTTAVTGVISCLFTKYVEPLGKKGEQLVERKITKS